MPVTAGNPHHVEQMSADRIHQSDVEELSLEQTATHLLEECRMVLPGIQALFGFQFVAVFSARFSETLTPAEQRLHLGALVCVAFAAALVMAPAALQRHSEPRSVSERFIRTSSRLLMWSMPPLAVGTTVDTYLVAHVITTSVPEAVASALAVLLAFVLFWAVLPRWRRYRPDSS